MSVQSDKQQGDKVMRTHDPTTARAMSTTISDVVVTETMVSATR